MELSKADKRKLVRLSLLLKDSRIQELLNTDAVKKLCDDAVDVIKNSKEDKPKGKRGRPKTREDKPKVIRERPKALENKPKGKIGRPKGSNKNPVQQLEEPIKHESLGYVSKPGIRRLLKAVTGVSFEPQKIIPQRPEGEWKPVKGFEGLYEVSDSGNVWNVKTHKILNQSLTFGYKRVHLRKDGKSAPAYIHRLIAEAFIPNPNNYSDVHHIDGNKENNTVSNLEWCERLQPKLTPGVIQYCGGEPLKIWPSAYKAAKALKISPGSITGCCNKKMGYLTAGGCTWEWVDGHEVIPFISDEPDLGE